MIQYVDDFRVTRVRAPNIIDGAIKKLWSLGLDKIDFVFFCRPKDRSETNLTLTLTLLSIMV